MVFGDTIVGYLFVWLIQKFAEAEKNAEKECPPSRRSVQYRIFEFSATLTLVTGLSLVTGLTLVTELALIEDVTLVYPFMNTINSC